MTSDENKQPSDDAKHAESKPPPLPSINIANSQRTADSAPKFFKFGQILGGLIAIIGALTAGESAGLGRSQILASIVCIVIIAATANDAYLVIKNRSQRWNVFVQAAAGVVAFVFLILEFYGWPFGSGNAVAKTTLTEKQTSCNTSTLLRPSIVTQEEANSQLIYKVVSTPTHPGDQTAVAHEIYPSGWIQQVFLATRNNIGTVSAIISTQVAPRPAIAITFQIRTLRGQIIGSIHAAYNGSANNKDFANSFRSPISIKADDLYVLRVINNSTRNIYMYAHYYYAAQVAPYEVPACEYNSGDGGPDYFTMRDNQGSQILSGYIESSGK